MLIFWWPLDGMKRIYKVESEASHHNVDLLVRGVELMPELLGGLVECQDGQAPSVNETIDELVGNLMTGLEVILQSFVDWFIVRISRSYACKADCPGFFLRSPSSLAS